VLDAVDGGCRDQARPVWTTAGFRGGRSCQGVPKPSPGARSRSATELTEILSSTCVGRCVHKHVVFPFERECPHMAPRKISDAGPAVFLVVKFLGMEPRPRRVRLRGRTPGGAWTAGRPLLAGRSRRLIDPTSRSGRLRRTDRGLSPDRPLDEDVALLQCRRLCFTRDGLRAHTSRSGSTCASP